MNARAGATITLSGSSGPEIEDNGSFPKRIIFGAAAGLAAGLIASFAMNAFQALLPAPGEADTLPATVVTADRLSVALTGEKLAERHHDIAGEAVHYGLGAVLGLAYGVIAEFDPRITQASGIPFGVGVALILDEIVVPALAITPPPWKFGPGIHLYSIASHMVFGLSAEIARWTCRPGVLFPVPDLIRREAHIG